MIRALILLGLAAAPGDASDHVLMGISGPPAARDVRIDRAIAVATECGFSDVHARPSEPGDFARGPNDVGEISVVGRVGSEDAFDERLACFHRNIGAADAVPG